MTSSREHSGAEKTTPATSSSPSRAALRFVFLIGITSLFADFTYESARSINGQFLATLGASATVVGFTAGFGELVGYGLRSVFGWLADKTRRYWLTAIMGYVVNLFAVPALALAGNWQAAAALVIAERAGRAMRKPPVEAMPRAPACHGLIRTVPAWQRARQPARPGRVGAVLTGRARPAPGRQTGTMGTGMNCGDTGEVRGTAGGRRCGR
jgi:hypothetical protein